MMGVRRRPKLIQWEPTESGWRCGRYDVALERPGRWTLQVDGRRRSAHRRASDAGAEARVVERIRRRRHRIGRNLAAIAVAGLTLLVAQFARSVPNDEYAAAAAFVLVLEGGYRAIESGAASVDSFVGQSGIIGGAFTADLPFDLGDGARVEPRDYVALVGMHNQECYVVRWTPGGAVFSGVLAPDLPCEPAPRLIQPGLFIRAASQSPNASAFNWEDVLPPRESQARWFVPLVLVTVFVMLQGVVGATLALIRPVRHRIPPLTVSVGESRSPPTSGGAG